LKATASRSPGKYIHVCVPCTAMYRFSRACEGRWGGGLAQVDVCTCSSGRTRLLKRMCTLAQADVHACFNSMCLPWATNSSGIFSRCKWTYLNSMYQGKEPARRTLTQADVAPLLQFNMPALGNELARAFLTEQVDVPQLSVPG
jgi:hypothetical protein